MWVFFARSPPQDAPYWPGRRWLAALDAVAWPGLVGYWLSQFAMSGGLVAALAMAMLVLAAGRRLATALHANHRYRFTTWRYCRLILWFMAIGAMLKVSTQLG